MDLWVVPLLLLVVVVMLVVAVIATRHMNQKRRERDRKASEAAYEQKRKAKAESRASRCPVDLTIGNVAQYKDQWFDVTGKVSYKDAEGYEWFDFRLQNVDTKERCWFSAEKTEDWEIVLWRDCPDRSALPESPNVKKMTYNGEAYTLDERGTANYDVEGQTDLKHKAGSVKYVDFKGHGGKLLSFEQYDGGPWEVSVGVICDVNDVSGLPTSV